MIWSMALQKTAEVTKSITEKAPVEAKKVEAVAAPVSVKEVTKDVQVASKSAKVEVPEVRRVDYFCVQCEMEH